MVLEVIVQAVLVICAIALEWHINTCKDYLEDRHYIYVEKLLCSGWYKPIEVVLECAAIVCKFYFIMVARQNWRNMELG